MKSSIGRTIWLCCWFVLGLLYVIADRRLEALIALGVITILLHLQDEKTDGQ